MLIYELLRIAIGTQDFISRAYSHSEWQACYNLAEKQGVIGVCFGAIEKILSDSANNHHDKDIALSSSLKMQWIGSAISIQSIYNKHKAIIEKLALFYGGLSVKMLLLKGYGISLNYPRPYYRPVGDIDIYLFGKKEYADYMIEKELFIKVDTSYQKHSHFLFDGVTVENHMNFLDNKTHKSNVKLENELENILRFESSPIDNCYVPSATWNALFLLRHTGEHFAANEISLRHILDLGTFFKSKYDEINWEYILKVYEDEGMKPFYNAISSICVYYLRIPDYCFKGYKFDAELADRVLHDIIADKEVLPMTTKDIHGNKLLKYGINKTIRWWHNRWKYKMVYKENLFESFWTLAKNRMFNWQNQV